MFCLEDDRAKLACEVIAAVRRMVGDRLAVLVRVAGEEYGEEGALSVEETIAAARLFEAAGAGSGLVSIQLIPSGMRGSWRT